MNGTHSQNSPITPNVKNVAGEIFTPGRHHWGDVFPCFFAGGGIQPGRIIGRTDAQGGLPITEAYTPEDLAATIFHCLGNGREREFHDSSGRPVSCLPWPTNSITPMKRPRQSA